MKKKHFFARFNRCIGAAVILVLVLQSTPKLHAQNTENFGNISGLVVSSDGKLVSNIEIELSQNNKKITADTTSKFGFAHIPYGKYKLTIKGLGIKSQIKIIELNADQLDMSTIYLDETAAQLDDVTVYTQTHRNNKNAFDVARMPLSNLENSQVYNVVPKELLTEQIVTTQEGALQNVPGLANIATLGGGGGTMVGFLMRGFNNGSTILRDGISSGYVSLMDMSNVEKLEAIKGPSSTLFGGGIASSYGGVINMVTKQPFEYQKGEITYTTGSYNLSRTTVDFNTPLNQNKTALFRITGAYDNRYTFQQNVKQNTVAFSPNLRLLVNDRLTLDFNLNYYQTHRPILLMGLANNLTIKNVSELNLDPKMSYYNGDLRSNQQTVTAYAKADYKLSDKWTSHTIFSTANSNNNSPYIFLTLTAKDAIARRVYDLPVSSLNTQEFQQNFNGDFKIGKLRNRMLIGLDYFRTYAYSERGNIIMDTINTHLAPTAVPVLNGDKVNAESATTTYSSTQAINNIYSAYVSDVLNLTDNLLVMGSIRVDRYNSVGKYMQTAYSPKFGLVYEILPNHISLFGNYQNGFQNVSGTDSLGNSFKPQKANQLEGGAKFDLADHRFNATVSYYHINVKDIVRTPANAIYGIQDGNIRSQGVELDINANPIDGLFITAGYAYNDIKIVKAANNQGKRPYGTPANVANFWMSYKFKEGIFHNLGIGVGANGASKSFTSDANTITLNGYIVAAASLFYDTQSFRLSAKVDNLANKKYFMYNSYLTAQQPRTITASIAYKF